MNDYNGISSTVKIKSINKNKIKKELSGWAIIIPGLILFAFFIWIPLIQTMKLSVFSTEGMSAIDFVGFDNFISVFNDSDFLPALRNTVLYTVWSLLIGFLVPIIMAMFLNEVAHAKGLFRVGTYLPNVVPGLATVLMWQYIFGSGDTGVLNILLNKLFHIGPQEWLTNATIIIPVIVVIMTWKGAGATALIYLAGLQGINPELYEAAAMDGAGIFRRIWHIQLPNVYNLARTMLILQIISVFQIIYEPLVLTNGGPNDASISLMLLMYNYAFVDFDYARASSVSLIIAALLITFTAIYMRLSKRKEM